MSGQWANSTRASRLPSNWRAIRAQVLKRDGYQCTHIDPPGRRCQTVATEVDHIEAMTDLDDPAALQSLCAPHHAQKTSREGNTERWRYRDKRKPEQHPGMRRP